MKNDETSDQRREMGLPQAALLRGEDFKVPIKRKVLILTVLLSFGDYL